ncbi:MAG: hypothetical protein V4598_02995 [Bdellovibrionota bacterium]
MWQILFVFPCALLFFFLTLFVGIFDESLILQMSFILLFSVLLIPIYYDQLPPRWSVSRKLRTHFIFTFSWVMLLHVGFQFRMGVLKEKSFNYQYAHLSGPFRTLYSVMPVQFLLSNVYRATPLNIRIKIYQTEDLARVERIEKEVNSEFSRSLICYEKDKATCFINVVKASHVTSPTGTNGTVALFEKGSKFLKEEETLRPELHQVHVQQSLELLKLIGLLATREDTELSHLVPGFPEDTKRPELITLLQKEKKARFILAHQNDIIPRKAGRKIAGKAAN